MRTAGKKQYSPAGRLADICKAIPQHNYLWTSGPCKHRAIFFLMSSSVIFFLLYGMPSSILYFLSLLMFAFIHFIAPLPPRIQECVLFPLSFTISSTLHRHICNIVRIVFLPQYVVTFASSNFLPSFLQFHRC